MMVHNKSYWMDGFIPRFTAAFLTFWLGFAIWTIGHLF